MNSSIEILGTVRPPLRWIPEKRECTEEFLRNKSNDPDGPSYEDLTVGENSVLQEAQRILGRCLPPTKPTGRETGLVVGYVQSGKTLSFETVISLARDNGYGLVIVLAGTKNNLRDQSESRLKKDLGIDDGANWHHFSNPTSNVRAQIADRLSAWKARPVRKRAVLVTVLKHGGHIENLTSVLARVELSGIPTLIIDDESDQASLNTKAAKIRKGKAGVADKSTTYEKILNLRDEISHHSYLQYTATPQANLLLSQADILNPSFAEIVTPGDEYTGGKAFFRKPYSLVTTIPTDQVPDKNNQLSASPKTLLSALRFFLLVSAHHALTRHGRKDRNRSMMVHPANATASHQVYKAWLDRSLGTLRHFVERQYKGNIGEIVTRFNPEYDALRATYPGIRPLKELIVAMVEDVFEELNSVVVNGTPDAEKKVDWKAIPYWILVGGAKLDRGYTVEGLCVTYMPRPLGTSPAADTLQQRARFFGYKKPYLGLCRVFLQDSVKKAFVSYVDHEEYVRDALSKIRGKPLKDWRREFVLTDVLKATRANVVGVETRRIPVDGWMVPSVLQKDVVAAQENRLLLKKVEGDWKKKYGPSVNASTIDRFKNAKKISPNFVIESVPVRALLEDFFLEIQVKDHHDAEEHGAILIALATLLKKRPNLVADVFLMNNLKAGYRTRVEGRGVKAKDKFAPINQYFSQSANAINDRSFCSPGRISLQLRRFDLGTNLRDSSSADIKDVTWYALNVPKLLKQDLLVEKLP